MSFNITLFLVAFFVTIWAALLLLVVAGRSRKDPTTTPEYTALRNRFEELECGYFTLYRRWSRLEKRYAELAASHMPRSARGASPFTQQDIKRLLQLCHPDKHGGSEMAGAMTAKLLSMRD